MIHNFPSHANCKRCPLWEGAQNVGLPTRPADVQDDQSHASALLIIGEAPGYYEDRDGKTWIHTAGDHLHRLIKAANLHKHADIYLSNAVRCHPPQGQNPTGGQVKICRAYLEADMRSLLSEYEKVFVLCAGAVAARAAGFKSLKASFHVQGYTHEWFPDLSFPTFYTYHPAALLPGKYGHSKGRDPSKIRAVVDHLKLLWEVLSDNRHIDDRTVMPERAPLPPTTMPEVLSLDIETYGILRGWEQTVFHPRQAEVIDGVKRGQQIVIVTLSWEEESCPRLSQSCFASSRPRSEASPSTSGGCTERHAVFVWKDWDDRRKLHAWIRKAIQDKCVLLGKHFLFDLMFLRYNDPVLRYLLNIQTGPRLEDLEIWNHLEYELRPEKGLKPLAELLGVATYKTLKVHAKDPNRRAKSPYDRNLWLYGATDTASTLRSRSVLLQRIAQRYGPHCAKLSPTCREFHSQLLWSTLYMAEAGLTFDLQSLRALHEENRDKANSLAEEAKTKYGLLMCGTGCRKSQQALLQDAIETEQIDPLQLERTPKTQQFCINDKNIDYIITEMEPGHPVREALVLMRTWRNYAYRLSHFTGPLLEKPRRGITERVQVGSREVGIAYPSWHLVPSGYQSSDDSAGGTIQGRSTCTKPPAQTFPSWIKETYTSIHPGGVLLAADSSQIELRVAALISGDPFMLSWFEEGRDPHADTTHLIFDEFGITEDDPLWRSVYRQAGKHSNFRLIYGGGVEKLQSILWHFVGEHMDVARCFPYEKCLAIDAKLKKTCHIYFQWKKTIPDIAGRRGYLEVHTGWSRTFSGGVGVVRRTYANECSNFPIQTLSAQLIQSAQYAIQRELVSRGLKTCIRLNVYDSLLFDCPPEEESIVLEIIDGPLKRPPLMAIIREALGREILLDYDVKRIVA